MEFENEYKNTRSGFSHTSKLYHESGNLLAEAKCNYLNRTWESYPFQSSMKMAIAKAIDNEINEQKRQRGIKRLTKQKLIEIEAYSSTIQQLKTLYKTI
jgi:hypothetical protein